MLESAIWNLESPQRPRFPASWLPLNDRTGSTGLDRRGGHSGFSTLKSRNVREQTWRYFERRGAPMLGDAILERAITKFPKRSKPSRAAARN